MHARFLHQTILGIQSLHEVLPSPRGVHPMEGYILLYFITFNSSSSSNPMQKSSFESLQEVANSIMRATFALQSLLGISSLVLSHPTVFKRETSPDAAALLVPRAGGRDAVPTCWVELSCTFDEIQSMDMSTRLSFVRYMEANQLQSLNCGDQFRAIEGVIEFFIDKDIGTPGTWVSYV